MLLTTKGMTIIICFKLNYWMTYKQILQLLYNNGSRLACKFPSSWNDNKVAGIDWLQGFTKRHKNLPLHKPENISLFRATAFNKINVIEYVNN
jgi:hypothetical protein